MSTMARLVSGHDFSRALSRFLMILGFSPLLNFCRAKYLKQYGNSSTEVANPFFTGFCAMYSRCRRKFSRSSIRTCENPRCHTSPVYPNSFFNRYEKPPLMSCTAFSIDIISIDRDQQMDMIRHNHEIVHAKLSGGHVRTQHVNQQGCIPFRLK
jgi:hypothetical protein